MPPSEASSPIAIGSEKNNLVEVQGKDFKIAIMNMFKDLNKDMNECLNEDHEKTNS